MSILKHTEESNFGDVLYRFEILRDDECNNHYTMRLYVAKDIGDVTNNNFLGLNFCGRIWMLCYSESITATSLKRAISKTQLLISDIMEQATATM